MSCITTYPTLKSVDLLAPTLQMIDVRDIAHALGGLRRFNGYTREYYTVAEHCVIGSWIIREEFALEFLMHDAHEAYVGDVTSPLKDLLGATYANIADSFDEVIAHKFGLDCSDECFEEVRRVDMLMREAEFGVLKYKIAQVPAQDASADVKRAFGSVSRFRSHQPAKYFLDRFYLLAAQRYLDAASEGFEGVED